jgi:hypothetical protein
MASDADVFVNNVISVPSTEKGAEKIPAAWGNIEKRALKRRG